MTAKAKTWWLLGGGVLAVVLLSGGASAVVPGAGGCGYQPTGKPFDKGQDELRRRIHARIIEANPNLDLATCDELNGRSCALMVAGALAQADSWGLPVDLVTAIAWRESRFNLEIDNIGQRIAEGAAIGPLQVRPIAFRDVGMSAQAAITLPLPAKLQYVTAAGLKYLQKLRTHYLPGASWCDVLHAYNVGPTAFAQGQRNHGYVGDIIRQAKRYSELRTM